MVRDVPLSEITLRKYEKPYDVSKRETVRKVCLSLGLLQPGDSRDVVVDILLALDDARRERKELTSVEVQELVEKIRRENSLDSRGLAESNIRRQLKRLRDLMLVDKRSNLYRLSEFEHLGEIFEKRIHGFLIPQTVERIREYLGKLEK
jgi:DNA-binding transcriptional ArsR family regulator